MCDGSKNAYLLLLFDMFTQQAATLWLLDFHVNISIHSRYAQPDLKLQKV